MTYAIYSKKLDAYLHAHDIDVKVITWCKEQEFALKLPWKQIEKLYHRVKLEYAGGDFQIVKLA